MPVFNHFNIASPEDVKAEMRFHPVMTLGEVLALALEPAPAHALP